MLRRVVNVRNNTVLRIIPSYIGIYLGFEHHYSQLFSDIPEIIDEKTRRNRSDPTVSPKDVIFSRFTH